MLSHVAIQSYTWLEQSDWDVDLSAWKYMFLLLMSLDPSAFVQGKGHDQTRSHFTHWWNNRKTKIVYNCNHTLQPHNQSYNMFWATVYNTNATRLSPKATSWCRSLKSSFFINRFFIFKWQQWLFYCQPNWWVMTVDIFIFSLSVAILIFFNGACVVL